MYSPEGRTQHTIGSTLPITQSSTRQHIYVNCNQVSHTIVHEKCIYLYLYICI